MAVSEKGVVVVTGHDQCFRRAKELIEKFNLPGGLLPMENIEEVTFDVDTGLFHVRQKAPIIHKFPIGSGKLVSYAEDVKGYLQPNRIRNLTGVKSKELFVWAPIGDISVDDPPTDKIHFKSFGGIGKSHPTVAFAPAQ